MEHSQVHKCKALEIRLVCVYSTMHVLPRSQVASLACLPARVVLYLSQVQVVLSKHSIGQSRYAASIGILGPPLNPVGPSSLQILCHLASFSDCRH
jgi:hypothetical protein